MTATIKTTNLQHGSSGSANIVLGSDGSTTIADGNITASAVTTALLNGGQLAGFRNKIIDGGFTINQRGYSSGTTLSAGSYGHDRWKAGASGGDYSFTQLASNTTITIASGKTLIQVIEDKNVEGGSYVLSWTGTAQARYGVDSATPSGSYASSPVTISGQSAGTVMSVEFNEGTLGSVQLEIGDTATTFEQRGFGTELQLCQRYYEKSYDIGTPAGSTAGNITAGLVGGTHYYSNVTPCPWSVVFKVKKRATPTIQYWDRDGNLSKHTTIAYSSTITDNVDGGANMGPLGIGEHGFLWYVGDSAGGQKFSFIHYAASAEL